eukprot:276219-Prorocentrum_minimum.AAC.1
MTAFSSPTCCGTADADVHRIIRQHHPSDGGTGRTHFLRAVARRLLHGPGFAPPPTSSPYSSLPRKRRNMLRIDARRRRSTHSATPSATSRSSLQPPVEQLPTTSVSTTTTMMTTTTRREWGLQLFTLAALLSRVTGAPPPAYAAYG